MSIKQKNAIPYNGKQGYAVLYYASNNRGLASEYLLYLQMQGARIWFDENGDVDNIKSKMNEANLFILFYTKSCDENIDVNELLQYAKKTGKKVMICCFEKTMNLDKKLPTITLDKSFIDNCHSIEALLKNEGCFKGYDVSSYIVKQETKKSSSHKMLSMIIIAVIIMTCIYWNLQMFPNSIKNTNNSSSIENEEVEMLHELIYENDDLEVYYEKNELLNNSTVLFTFINKTDKTIELEKLSLYGSVNGINGDSFFYTEINPKEEKLETITFRDFTPDHDLFNNINTIRLKFDYYFKEDYYAWFNSALQSDEEPIPYENYETDMIEIVIDPEYEYVPNKGGEVFVDDDKALLVYQGMETIHNEDYYKYYFENKSDEILMLCPIEISIDGKQFIINSRGIYGKYLNSHTGSYLSVNYLKDYVYGYYGGSLNNVNSYEIKMAVTNNDEGESYYESDTFTLILK